jgi:hypothetical protein
MEQWKAGADNGKLEHLEKLPPGDTLSAILNPTQNAPAIKFRASAVRDRRLKRLGDGMSTRPEDLKTDILTYSTL